MTIQHEDEEISFKVETDAEVGGPVFENKDEPQDLAVDEALLVESLDASNLPKPADEDLAEEILAELAAGDRDITDDEDALDLSSLPEVDTDEEEQMLEGASAAEGASDIEIAKDDSLAIPEELTAMGKIEAILFASPKPLRTVEIHELLMDQGYTLKEVQDALDELTEFYRDRAGGFHLKYIKRMGYQFQTTTAAKALMEKQFSSRPRPLSRASLETLAVVAYRQKGSKFGVTRAEVEFIRGVDAGSIFKTLVERNLLTCVGRKEIPGRPMMFGVTDEFLKVFQLGSINDLPPLESFQTPTDVINAANEKIAQFEAEQEGVDPEEFIGDEAYTEDLGDSEFDILAAEAAPYAPSLPRLEEVRQEVLLAEQESAAMDEVPSDILAAIAAETLDEVTDAEMEAATIEASHIAVPASVIESMTSDLMDRIDEGQIAFEAPQKTDHEDRSLEGARLAVDDGDWGDDNLGLLAMEETSSEVKTLEPAMEPEVEPVLETVDPLVEKSTEA